MGKKIDVDFLSGGGIILLTGKVLEKLYIRSKKVDKEDHG
jgi:hypothetical protein